MTPSEIDQPAADQLAAMTIMDLFKIASDEYRAFLAAEDRRTHAQERGGLLYDTYIEPLDLPGPDALIDPIGRAGFVWLVGVVYDAVVERLADDKPHPPWPALPGANKPAT